MLQIALIPDRFALYRATIFRKLSEFYDLEIYADTARDLPGVVLYSAEHCDTNKDNGGVVWHRVQNVGVKGICFWQKGVATLPLRTEHEIYLMWGEAHRISSWVCACLALLLKRNVVFWTHGAYGNERFLKRSVRRVFYSLANGILFYGEHGKRAVESLGVFPQASFAINNSLNTDKQMEVLSSAPDVALIKSRYFNDRDCVLVFIGRITKQKQLHLLLEALAKLPMHYKLLLVGDGPELTSLKVLADQLGVADRIVFYGACYNEEETGPLLMMADMCVSPGEVGLTAMHSLVYGTPVITHSDFTRQMPESEAIIEGETGGFFERGNVSSLVESILTCNKLIEEGQITEAKCRAIIEKQYSPKYQLHIFGQMVARVLDDAEPACGTVI